MLRHNHSRKYNQVISQVAALISKIPMNVKATTDTGMVFRPPLVDDTNLSSVSTVDTFLKCSLLELCKNKKQLCVHM